MDFKELFESASIVRVKYRGHMTEHHLRQATAAEDLEYRRRSSKINFKSRRVETTDSALEAPIWLYDKLIEKVLIQNSGPDFIEVPLDTLKNQNQLKLAVINAVLSDIEREEEGELKN